MALIKCPWCGKTTDDEYGICFLCKRPLKSLQNVQIETPARSTSYSRISYYQPSQRNRQSVSRSYENEPEIYGSEIYEPVRYAQTVTQTPNRLTKYCHGCGYLVDQESVICPRCGIQVGEFIISPQRQQPKSSVVINNTQVNVSTPNFPQREKITTLLLCIFLGFFGVHRFYTGRVLSGLLWLFTGGLWGIGWAIDIICIIAGSFHDNFGRPLIDNEK